MKLLVWLRQFVPPSMCLSLGLSCCLASYWYKIRCCGSTVSLHREIKGKGPRQCRAAQLTPHCNQPRITHRGEHHQLTSDRIVLKRTSSLRFGLGRVRSEAGLPVWLLIPVQGLPGNHSASQRTRQLQSVALQWRSERVNQDPKGVGCGMRQPKEKTGSRGSHAPVLTSLDPELKHLLQNQPPYWLGWLGWGSWWGEEGNVKTSSALKCAVTCWSQRQFQWCSWMVNIGVPV